jgi:hypothetical protein
MGYFLPRGSGYHTSAEPHRLVATTERMVVGGVEFVFTPIAGGETHDGLLIQVPDRQAMFTGDMIMPYLGAPFYAEGSAEGLFEAMRTVMAARPGLLIHGHTGLTESFTIQAFPGLLAALRDLYATVRSAVTAGLTLGEILHLNHLPQVLEEHPLAVLPYLVMREHFIRRVQRQETGYWHPGGEGIEVFTPAQLATAADLLGGGASESFLTAGIELARRAEHALALHVIDLGLIRHPQATGLIDFRRLVLDRLVAQNQFLDPFKFIHYASRAELNLEPAG